MEDDKLGKSEFWMRIAGAAFALWALMIPIGIGMLRNALSDGASNSTQLAAEFAKYKLETEHRMTLLEDRQRTNVSQVMEHERRIDALDARLGSHLDTNNLRRHD